MQQLDNILTAGQRLIQKAQGVGSSAKTVRGALAYLRSQHTPAIPGLVALGKAAHTSSGIRYDRRIDFDRVLGWSHAARVSSRATALVAGLSGTTPCELLDAVQTASMHMTGDMRKAAHECVRQKIARCLERSLKGDWPYRTSASGWAGGQHSLEVFIADAPGAAGWSTRVWSSNGKWSGTNSSAQLAITERCIRTLGHSLIEGGLIAVDAECVGNREYRVVWVEQSRGFDLKLVEGWLIRGYHVAGGTLEIARKKATKARVRQAIERRVARLQGQVDSGTYDLSTVMVSRDDSIKAGNCSAGTKAFMKRFEQTIAGRKALPADELLGLERSPYSLAAVTYALARTQHNADVAFSAAL